MAQHYRNQKVDKDVYSLTIERIERIFDIFDNVTVSFSGGKDSTAVLNTALEVAERRGRLPLRAIFYDEECIPLETVEYVTRVQHDPRVNLEWYCVPLQCRNACSSKEPFWYPWAPEDKDKWVRPLPEGAITSLPFLEGVEREQRPGWPEINHLIDNKSGSSIYLLGIRAQESLMRQAAVTNRKEDNYIIKLTEGMYKGYPIYDWQTEDVWTAPAIHDWDYNHAYDNLEMLGIPAHAQRCAPPFGEEPMQKLWVFKEAFPQIWDKMIARAPGVATAARYSNTELYGFGGGIEKPYGINWASYIKELLEKQPETKARVRFDMPKSLKAGQRSGERSAKGEVVQNIMSMIDSHYKMTGGLPILEDAKHPRSGVSWKFLASIAMRGDYKGRRSLNAVAIKFEHPNFTKMLKKYETELQQIKDDGRLWEIQPTLDSNLESKT
jgi:predicted phosphoadenosine phosphosulfate sulfurtransferase